MQKYNVFQRSTYRFSTISRSFIKRISDTFGNCRKTSTVFDEKLDSFFHNYSLLE